MGLDEDLIKAAEKGDLAAARAALDGGANCDCKDKVVRRRVRRRAHDAAPCALRPRAALQPAQCGLARHARTRWPLPPRRTGTAASGNLA
jgi:hypothetical protein